jgi:hypothetical protein
MAGLRKKVMTSVIANVPFLRHTINAVCPVILNDP